MKKQTKNTSTTTGKIGIALLWIGILAVSIAGFSYSATGTKGTGVSCPMMKNVSTIPTTTRASGGCPMMGNRAVIQAAPVTPSKVNTQAKVITMQYNDSWLTPSTITVQKGKSYTIQIKLNTTINGCMSTITLPGLDDSIKNITKGTTICFIINPTSAGTYWFVCAMGLSHGAQVVVQ